MARLEGKVAVITGGGAGIGLAAGKLFVQEGAQVLLVDIREDALQKAVKEIGGNRVRHVEADVTQPDQVEHFVQTAVNCYGGIDIFIANAGMLGAVKPITEYPVEIFDKVMQVNVRGVWLGLKYVIPQMQKRGGGSIVITSSISGVKGFPGMTGYVASKHATVGIMRCIANECAPMNIRVNTVNPGCVETDMGYALADGFAPGAREEGIRTIEDGTPLKRLGKPEEVAQMMLFLASGESGYCTGGVFGIDGGMSAL
jgi:NAD(P)-dependent dehydrogenase (short-subunit alcohol dehydrogenase family)